MCKLPKREYLAGVLIFALVWAGPAAVAQKPAQIGPDEIGVVYLGNGQVLAAVHPRLLTKNAHVAQFLCSPEGTRIAYLGETAGLEGVDSTLAIVSTQSGEATTYYHSTLTSPNNSDSALLNGLEGWSDDSAYCAFVLTEHSPLPAGSADIDHLEAVDLVHDSTFDIPLPLDQIFGAQSGSSTTQLMFVALEGAAWAPGQRQIAYIAQAQTTAGTRFSCLCLCDADRRSTRLLFQSPESLSLAGWQDSTHLVYFSDKGEYVYDLATGKSLPEAHAAAKVARRASRPVLPTPVVTDLPAPGNEALSLAGIASTVSGPDKTTATDTTIWLSRTGGSAKQSHLELDSFPNALAPIGLGDPQFLSNGGFDREGEYHVVYDDEGDLKIVDLSSRAATPGEKLAGGDKLTCQEEMDTVVSDARQIGLAILMYVADNNQTFPAAGDFQDAADTYLKSSSLLTSPNGEAFQYLAPADSKLADMEDPQNTPLGKFVLPCADIVLWGDGHVKAEQK